MNIKRIFKRLTSKFPPQGNFNVNGIPDGYWEIYFSDGQLAYKGKYNMGQQIGFWFEDKINFYARI